MSFKKLVQNPKEELANIQAAQTLRLINSEPNDATFYSETMQKSISKIGLLAKLTLLR